MAKKKNPGGGVAGIFGGFGVGKKKIGGGAKGGGFGQGVIRSGGGIPGQIGTVSPHAPRMPQIIERGYSGYWTDLVLDAGEADVGPFTNKTGGDWMWMAIAIRVVGAARDEELRVLDYIEVEPILNKKEYGKILGSLCVEPGWKHPAPMIIKPGQDFGIVVQVHPRATDLCWPGGLTVSPIRVQAHGMASRDVV
jgi:hypothetical protein